MTTVSEPAAGRSFDRILKKALEFFSSKGYGATAVREICEAAGITKPTLYHFFGSKEGVYRALVEGTLERYRDAMVRAVAPPGTARERLKRFAWEYFHEAMEQADLVRFIFGLFHNPPSSAPKTDFPKFHREVVDVLGGCLDAGVAAGELRPGDSQLRLIVFLGALGEALCGGLIVGELELTPAFSDALVDTVLDGWTAPRAVTPQDGIQP